MIGLDISGGLLIHEAACRTVVDGGDAFGCIVAIVAAYSLLVADDDDDDVVFDCVDSAVVDVDFCWVKIFRVSDIVCTFCDLVPLLKNPFHCS